MQAVTTIGLDIAKSVFQVHGIDAEDNVLISRRLKRRYVLALFAKLPPCLVGIEAAPRRITDMLRDRLNVGFQGKADMDGMGRKSAFDLYRTLPQKSWRGSRPARFRGGDGAGERAKHPTVLAWGEASAAFE
jgi:transposase